MKQIETAFRNTTSLLFGKPLHNLGDYEKWLMKYVVGFTKKKSQVSEKQVYVLSWGVYEEIGSNAVKYKESLALGNRSLTPEDVEELCLGNAHQKLSKISTTTPEVLFQRDLGSVECACHGNTQYCFRSTLCWFSKLTGYSHWTRDAHCVFGSSNLIDCSLCINIYNSTKLARCFEVNDSNACSDCYFCHNCDGLENCMFCFNAKGLRYAIANREIGREQYMRIKKILQDYILRELEDKKALQLDIFSMGTKKKKTVRR